MSVKSLIPLNPLFLGHAHTGEPIVYYSWNRPANLDPHFGLALAVVVQGHDTPYFYGCSDLNYPITLQSIDHASAQCVRSISKSVSQDAHVAVWVILAPLGQDDMLVYEDLCEVKILCLLGEWHHDNFAQLGSVKDTMSLVFDTLYRSYPDLRPKPKKDQVKLSAAEQHVLV